MEKEFRVALHVQVSGCEVGELHRAFGPVGFHGAERESRTDDEVFDVAGVDAVADLEESALPRFSLPAMGRVGIDGECVVAVTDVDEHEEIVGGRGGCAGVDFVTEFDAELFCVSADFGGFGDETVFTLFEEIKVCTCPEAPRVSGCEFPSEGDAPEHRECFHTEFGGEVE